MHSIILFFEYNTIVKKFPNYLRSNLLLNGYTFNGHTAKADLQCKCGCVNFELLYPGETIKQEGKPYPCGIDTNEGGFFVIEAKCSKCKQIFSIFDQDFHGWDGFQCYDHEQATLPRPPLIPWICLSCGQLPHRITIKIDHTDYNEYIKWLDKAKKTFDENEWLLSFEWVWMTIECESCGLITKDWVDSETA